MKPSRILPFAAALAACSLTLAAPAAVRASGFGINEHSARGMGMGGAFTAVADGPSAIFFNPAGLAQLKGLQLEAGVTFIAPQASYTGQAPGTGTEVDVDAEQLYFVLPNLHAAYRVHERLAVGFGVFLPYGLSMLWPDKVDVDGQSTDWWGRGIIREIALQTVNFTPTLAVSLHPRVLLGAGLTIVKAAVTLKRAVTFSSLATDDIDFVMSGDDVGFGATAGLLVKVLPDTLHVGVAYRSAVSFTFEGDGAFTKDGSGAAVPAGLRTKLTDGSGEADLTLPHVISFGVAAFPFSALTLGFGLDIITWSTYDKLELRFANNPELDTSEPKEWSNTIAVRLGAEYHVLPFLPLRLGFVFDQGPVPDATLGPELPDGDRYEFSVGGGYHIGGFSVDLAYQFLFTGELVPATSAPLVGSYRATGHLLGLSLGYSMDI